jgi:hypothetical protein
MKKGEGGRWEGRIREKAGEGVVLAFLLAAFEQGAVTAT